VYGRAIAAREVDHRPRRLRRPRADDLDADAVELLQRLPARHEGREQQVTQGTILEQQGAQLVTVDGDVAHRLRHHGREEHGLAGKEVDLAEESRGTVPDDLVSGSVHDGRFAFDDRDEGVAPIADLEEHVADVSAPLLAVLRKHRELRGGEDRARVAVHMRSLAIALRSRDRPGQAVRRRRFS